MTTSQDKPKLHKTSFLISDMLASPPTSSEPAPTKALDLRKSLACPPLSLPYLTSMSGLSSVSSLLARSPLSLPLSLRVPTLPSPARCKVSAKVWSELHTEGSLQSCRCYINKITTLIEAY